tara:strand:- start:160 stop:399 length:240 start_codon:yes stop_codon:yes gene_type:complete
MFSDAVRGEHTRARKRKRERDANAGDAIPGLLNDIVVAHVLRSEYFDDPAISHGSPRSRTALSGEPCDARRGGGDMASV